MMSMMCHCRCCPDPAGQAACCVGMSSRCGRFLVHENASEHSMSESIAFFSPRDFSRCADGCLAKSVTCAR
jgi:hypothetical protein